MENLAVKLLDDRWGKEFDLPRYGTSGSAGLDLRAMLSDPLSLEPGQAKLVPSGLAIHIENHKWVGLIMPRSGLGHKKGLVLGNLTGVIDADYQGPLMISLWNRSSETVHVQPGDLVAQLLLVPVTQVQLQVVDDFDHATVRGEQGFGHTGAT